MDQRKASARFYFFEDMVWDTPGFADLKVRRSLEDLLMLAAWVWVAEGGSGPCPTVRVIGRKESSYYLTSAERGKPGAISLATKHQCLGGLLHELAHALGHRDKLSHGPAFRRRCMRLYQVYGGWSGVIDWER